MSQIMTRNEVPLTPAKFSGIFGDVLSSTLTALDSGLQVQLIATYDLKVCQMTDDVEEVLKSDHLKDFDQIPVADGSSIVGVLERSPSGMAGKVSAHMRRLGDDLLVSADETLTRFIPDLAHDGYRLVVRGTAIRGIVTRSDLHKLPVRIVAFCLITHLEILLAELIKRRCGTDAEWCACLGSDRKKALRQTLTKLKRQRLNASLLEVTSYLDKRKVVSCLYADELGDEAPVFEREVDDITELRNSVAHAAPFADNDDEVRTFVRRLRQAQTWIDRLSRLLPTSARQAGE